MKKVLMITVAGMFLSAALAGPVQEPVQTGTEPVNINTASAEQLQALRGVGPALAKRIIEYREQHGGFERVEDLLLVRGIGEKKFLQLKEHVTVGD